MPDNVVPTVRVVNPNDPAGGYMIINVSDFVDGVHKPWLDKPAESHPSILGQHRIGPEYAAVPYSDAIAAGVSPAVALQEQSSARADDDLRIAKGPRGKWFLWRGKEMLSPGFGTEAEAQDALREIREPVA